jgi:hypothetical protein
MEPPYPIILPALPAQILKFLHSTKTNCRNLFPPIVQHIQFLVSHRSGTLQLSCPLDSCTDTTEASTYLALCEYLEN